MVIRSVQQTQPGVYEITPECGSAFFLRADYLALVEPSRLLPVRGGLGQGDALFIAGDDLRPGMQGVFGEDEGNDMLHAARVYSVEAAAMQYLARAEHCRAGLAQKLLKKGYGRDDVALALDYLEGCGYLDDERFAGAWLRTRFIDHAEGRRRLSAELASRGVGREAARNALDAYFEEHDEGELCRRACRKYLRLNRNCTPEKLRASLQRSGFSPAHISAAIAAEWGAGIP